MDIGIRSAVAGDLSFMKEMLYEAVFWRRGPATPTIEVGLELPDVASILLEWGRRKGDTALIAEDGANPVGSVWFRYWPEESNMRGYTDEEVPVLVIGVREDYRRKGIGGMLITEILKKTKGRISLCVSKDNQAYKLYINHGFTEFRDIGDSIIMVSKHKINHSN